MGLSIKTGQTVYEEVISIDNRNNVVVPTTFDFTLFKNGTEYTGVSISSSLVDNFRGVYSFQYTPILIGQYRLYVKNLTTDVIYNSNVVEVTSGSSHITVYTGE